MRCGHCHQYNGHAHDCPMKPLPLPVVTRNENGFVQVDMKSLRAMEALRKYLNKEKP